MILSVDYLSCESITYRFNRIYVESLYCHEQEKLSAAD